MCAYTNNELGRLTRITAEGVYAQSALDEKSEREDRLIFTFADRQKSTNVPRCDEIFFTENGIKITYGGAFLIFAAN